MKAMMKEIYLVRHCEAEGQPPESKLTGHGIEQAIHLAKFFSHTKIDQIIASPFKRAIQSVEPTSRDKNLQIEVDDRLAERTLSTANLSNWLEDLKATYDDLSLKFEGGESSEEATSRALNVVNEVVQNDFEKIILVTHGNLMSLILSHFDDKFGFEGWRKLSNPDVFLLEFKNKEVIYKRVWQDDLG